MAESLYMNALKILKLSDLIKLNLNLKTYLIQTEASLLSWITVTSQVMAWKDLLDLDGVIIPELKETSSSGKIFLLQIVHDRNKDCVL